MSQPPTLPVTFYDDEKQKEEAAGTSSEDASINEEQFAKQVQLESGHEIQYRTCSWQKVSTVDVYLRRCSANESH